MNSFVGHVHSFILMYNVVLVFRGLWWCMSKVKSTIFSCIHRNNFIILKKLLVRIIFEQSAKINSGHVLDPWLEWVLKLLANAPKNWYHCLKAMRGKGFTDHNPNSSTFQHRFCECVMVCTSQLPPVHINMDTISMSIPINIKGSWPSDITKNGWWMWLLQPNPNSSSKLIAKYCKKIRQIE